jgi:hypothetical protein
MAVPIREDRVKLLKIRHSIRASALVAPATLALALAACAPKAPPPPPPPPPPPVVVVPPQPMPPRGASPHLQVPPMSATGVRQTVNTGLSSAQTTWNLRAAYNVAALNCMQPQHSQIVVNYRAFLKAHVKALATANKAVDAEFKTKFGPRFIPPREAYMTQVYNYFALPPTLPSFCDAALAISNEAVTIKPAELASFSAGALPRIEAVFLQFYRSYDQYKDDLAGWQARYTSPAAAPAPVAITLPPAPGQPSAQ